MPNCMGRNGAWAHCAMVTIFQWKPFWLAAQLYRMSGLGGIFVWTVMYVNKSHSYWKLPKNNMYRSSSLVGGWSLYNVHPVNLMRAPCAQINKWTGSTITALFGPLSQHPDSRIYFPWHKGAGSLTECDRFSMWFPSNDTLLYQVSFFFFCQYVFYKDGQIANRS